MTIIPAVLGRTIDEVMEQTRELAGATTTIHLDVMDGRFVPEMTPLDLGTLVSTDFTYDLHLMVVDPEQFLAVMHRNEIQRVFVHAELSQHTLHRFFEAASEIPVICGLAINPNTSLDVVNQYREYIDSVLLMAVVPGAAGRAFDENAVVRLNQLRHDHKSFQLFVDGGVNEQTIVKIKSADAAVVHSAIFGHPETPIERIETLSKISVD